MSGAVALKADKVLHFVWRAPSSTASACCGELLAAPCLPACGSFVAQPVLARGAYLIIGAVRLLAAVVATAEMGSGAETAEIRCCWFRLAD